MDGVHGVISPPVFKTRGDNETMTVIKGDNGKLLAAYNGILSVLPIFGGIYATIEGENLDDDVVGSFVMDHVSVSGERRKLRAKVGNDNNVDPEKYGRSLQYGCSVFDVVEVGIVVDSYMCADAGGSANAAAVAASIVAEASALFEPFCKKLEIVDLVVFSDPATDPIRPLINAAGRSDVCGLASSFQGYLRGSGVRGDLVHLFHGYEFPDTTSIGCAWQETLCRTDGYQSGVNEMTFTSLLPQQAKLFAHEAGHNLNCPHSSSSSDVMHGSLCSSCGTGFGQASRDAINDMVARETCISQELSDPDATFAPTPTPACVDDLQFTVGVSNLGLKDCGWFELNAPWWYCQFEVVSTHCRSTCGGC